MNIIGTVYLVDEEHIDVLKSNLMNNPPPGGRIATGTMLCLDMDETDNMLEVWFPNHAQKATLLCPPPIAMYKSIDGDSEGFIDEYIRYLKYEESVNDFIASILLFLHLGGNILLYTPSNLGEDTVWLNTLMMFFYTEFGITIGTPTSACSYDPSYDSVIPNFMYLHGVMDLMDYIYSSTDIPLDPIIQSKLRMELAPMTPIGEDPLEIYNIMKFHQAEGLMAFKPAVTFDR